MKDLKDPETRLTSARRQMLFGKDAFIGTLLMRATHSLDSSVPTACTDGKVVRYNPAFLDRLTFPQVQTLIGHEVLHIGFGHHLLIGNRDPKIMNIAGDYKINQILQESGYEPIPGWLRDTRFDDPGLSVLDVYEILMSEANPKPQPEDGEGDEEGEEGEGSGDGGEGDGEGEGGEGKGKGKGKGKGGEGDGGGEGEGSGSGEGEGEGGGGGVPDPKDIPQNELGKSMGEVEKPKGFDRMTKDDLEKAQQEVRTILIQAAELAKSRGTLPGSLKGLVDEATVIEAPWHDLLRDMLTKAVAGGEQSFDRPLRTTLWQGVYLPSATDYTIETLVVVRDTSGSCFGALPEFNEHCLNIIRDLRPERVILMDCDSDVAAFHDIYPGDEFPREVGGGGGTSFKAPFDRIVAEGILPDAMIYLTDCCGDYPEEPGYPVFWACHGDAHETPCYTPPFGELVQLPT